MILVDGREAVGRARDRLGAAEEQIPAGAEREVEQLHDAILGAAAEVNEKIPARHEVEVREGRVLDEVVVGEQHRLAQLPANAVPVRLLDEEPAQSLGRDVGRVVRRVEAVTRHGDRLLVDVRGEDLYAGGLRERGGVFGEQHRERVGLLACGAPCGPHPDLVARAFPLEEPGEDGPGERAERLRVAEEIRHAYEQVLEKRVGLFRV